MARTKARRWLGIDGEGVGRKPHRYVMLACSDGDVIENPKGLGTAECLDFLITLSTRDVRLCGFYLNYDWTKILVDLPEDALYKLFRPETRKHEDDSGFDWIEWEGFRVHWLATAMWIGKGKRSTVIWDLGNFYQEKFVDALKRWKIAPEVQAQIEAMKEKRAGFTLRERRKIRDYCLSECRALSELATQLEAAHKDAGIVPRSWHGPGSTAGALLHRHGIGELRGSHPAQVLAAAQVAYVGGRAEIACNGRINRPVFGYDITSAYPYHASMLPCLMHSRWWKVTSERVLEKESVGIVCGEIERCNSDWGPLPVRLRTGSIVFPRGGARGYWYRDEWLAARSWPGTRLRFDHALVLRAECECRPFAFLRDVFHTRHEVGKNTGAGIVLKLAMNSVYGKLAQNVGSGQYQSRLWAGMITSGTRAQVLNLMADHQRLDSVIMVATDGVFSTEERETGPVELGGWERSDYPEGVTLVRPGIYFSGDKLRARGLGRENLLTARDALQLALDSGADRVELLPRTAFGTAKSSITPQRAGGFHRSVHYGQWFPIPTKVSLSPAPKRARDWAPPLLSGVESVPFGVKKAPEIALIREVLEGLREFS